MLEIVAKIREVGYTMLQDKVFSVLSLT